MQVTPSQWVAIILNFCYVKFYSKKKNMNFLMLMLLFVVVCLIPCSFYTLLNLIKLSFSFFFFSINHLLLHFLRNFILLQLLLLSLLLLLNVICVTITYVNFINYVIIKAVLCGVPLIYELFLFFF